MGLMAIGAIGLGVLIFVLIRMKRARERQELDRYSIEPEALHALLETNADVLVLDVRQPLDLLAFPETIPGAKRVAPKEIVKWIDSIPRDRETILYCTCPSDQTSRFVLKKALALEFSRTRVLKGGLAGWKARGFTVEPYVDSFHLDTAT
jgi:rhodanese-related sulfurtransferase